MSTDEPDMIPWQGNRPGSINCLQVVFKVVERCNINCSYCYYFNMGDESALDRPAKVSTEVARDLGRWIAEGCTTLDIPRAKISMHGGEPFLLGPERFSEVCDVLRQQISPFAEFELSVQTNGTILNNDWLKVFRRHSVRVGVSIDGEKIDHDRFRLDFRGRSTFEATDRNLRRLVMEAKGDPRLLPSTISVLNHESDYRSVYRYLRDVGIEMMSFLLPDRNADDQKFLAGNLPDAMGDRLVEIFDAWLEEDNPAVSVRFIDRVLGHFQIGAPLGKARPRKSVQILVARSDGTVTVDDSFIPALEWYQSSPVYWIASSPLIEVLGDPIFAQIEEVSNTCPTSCRSCRWLSMCGGGDLENRYSTKRGFDNPSVYCASLKRLYGTVSERLIARGYPPEQVEERFSEQPATI